MELGNSFTQPPSVAGKRERKIPLTMIGKSFHAKCREVRPGHGVHRVALVVQAAAPPPPPVPEKDWGDLAKRLRASRGQSSAAAAAQGSKREEQQQKEPAQAKAEPTLQKDLKETTLKNEQEAVEAPAIDEPRHRPSTSPNLCLGGTAPSRH